MKKTAKLLLGLAIAFSIFSCSKNDAGSSAITAEEAKNNAQIDLANDDVSDIVEGQFNATNANSTNGRTTEAFVQELPTCATITRVPAFGTPLTVGQTVTKTIDFGTTGCTMPNGNVLKGQIVMSFVFNPDATSHTINYQFVNFFHNAIEFNGSKTFTRTMSVATTSSPSHPIVVMNMDMTATFPNGNVYSRIGTRTREIIQGYNTPAILADNVYQVTGNWVTVYPNSTVQTSVITTPLLVKMSCIAVNKPLLVQGIITITRNGNTATLDYGTGDCDNLAVLTINGNSYNIVIGN